MHESFDSNLLSAGSSPVLYVYSYYREAFGTPLCPGAKLVDAANEFLKLHSNTALSVGYLISLTQGKYTAAKREEMEFLSSACLLAH